MYSLRGNKKKLIRESIFVQFIRITLFSHTLLIIYNQLYIIYMPIKYNTCAHNLTFIVDIVVGIPLSIVYIMLLVKLNKMCGERIIENRDWIYDINNHNSFGGEI